MILFVVLLAAISPVAWADVQSAEQTVWAGPERNLVLTNTSDLAGLFLQGYSYPWGAWVWTPDVFEPLTAVWANTNALPTELAGLTNCATTPVYGVPAFPLWVTLYPQSNTVSVLLPWTDIEMARVPVPLGFPSWQLYQEVLWDTCDYLGISRDSWDSLVQKGYSQFAIPQVVVHAWLIDLGSQAVYESNLTAAAAISGDGGGQKSLRVIQPCPVTDLLAPFAIIDIRQDSNHWTTITWESCTNFVYGVLSADKLGVNALCKGQTAMWGGDGTTIWTDTTTTNVSQRYYRVVRIPPTVGYNGDPIPSGWAVDNGLNPLDANLDSEVPDCGRLTNLEAYQHGTNPHDLRPMATVSGSATICAGQPATILAELTGPGPWTVTWSDGVITTHTSSPAVRSVSPSSTTTYFITALSNEYCSRGIASGSATVTIEVPSSTIMPSVVYLGSTNNTASVPTSLATLYSYNNIHNLASGVIQGSGSNHKLYGIDDDLLFRIDPDGSAVTPLFQFSESIISNGLLARIPIEGGNGNLYGVTRLGGNTNYSTLCSRPGYGTVYRISTNSGTLTRLHVFQGTPEGAFPVGQLVQGKEGDLYGVTEAGGVPDCPDLLCCATGYGTVHRISASNGTLTTLHRFTSGSDGAKPMAGLVQGSDGNLYGTTHEGGANGLGIIFKVSTNGDVYEVLHAFAGGSDDGANPVAALVQGSDGNLYGTTTAGGTNDLGTVFKVSTNGDTFGVIHAFTGGSDGANPPGALVQGGDGSFYGTTYLGGQGYGTIFKIAPQGALTTLYQFTGLAADGANPDYGGLVKGSNGYWYGATLNGGANGNGTVFRFLPVACTWSITGGTITAGLGSPMITFAVDSTCAVTLGVTAINDLGCSSSSSTRVAVSAPAPTGNSPCVGQTLDLAAPSITGAAYSWTGPNGFTSINQNPSIPNVQPCDSGQYCLSVTANGCTSDSSCVSVRVAAPQPTSNSPCLGQTLDLAAPSITGAMYSWTGPDGFTSTSQNPSIANVTADASGDYCVEVTIDGCTSKSSCLSVTVNTPPTATVSGSTNVCATSQATIYADLTGTPPWIVTWSDGSTTTTYDWRVSHTVSPSSTTSYWVEALSDANCSNGTGSDSATVTVPPPTSAVSVSDEVLIIYNTNVSASRSCKDYYINNRPGFSSANVLGCACITEGVDGFESITTEDLTNQIVNPIINFILSNPAKSIHYVVLMYGMPSRVSNGDRHSVQYHISHCMSEAGYTSGAYYEGSTCPFVAANCRGTTCLVTALNMGTLADCEAYINKLSNMYTGDVIISAKTAGHSNNNYFLDDTNPWPPGKAATFRGAILAQNPNASVTYSCSSVITNGSNVKGYLSWGKYGAGDNTYAIDGRIVWSGTSRWWIIETIESFNGQRGCSQGCVGQWFAANAWGGVNYSNTPVGAVSHVEEPYVGGVNCPTYMSLWENGYLFIECAWASRITPYFQAIGDPLIKQ